MVPLIASVIVLVGPPVAQGMVWWLDSIAKRNPGGWLARRRARKAPKPAKHAQR